MQIADTPNVGPGRSSYRKAIATVALIGLVTAGGPYACNKNSRSSYVEPARQEISLVETGTQVPISQQQPIVVVPAKGIEADPPKIVITTGPTPIPTPPADNTSVSGDGNVIPSSSPSPLPEDRQVPITITEERKRSPLERYAIEKGLTEDFRPYFSSGPLSQMDEKYGKALVNYAKTNTYPKDDIERFLEFAEGNTEIIGSVEPGQLELMGDLLIEVPGFSGRYQSDLVRSVQQVYGESEMYALLDSIGQTSKITDYFKTITEWADRFGRTQLADSVMPRPLSFYNLNSMELERVSPQILAGNITALPEVMEDLYRLLNDPEYRIGSRTPRENFFSTVAFDKSGGWPKSMEQSTKDLGTIWDNDPESKKLLMLIAKSWEDSVGHSDDAAYLALIYTNLALGVDTPVVYAGYPEQTPQGKLHYSTKSVAIPYTRKVDEILKGSSSMEPLDENEEWLPIHWTRKEPAIADGTRKIYLDIDGDGEMFPIFKFDTEPPGDKHGDNEER